MNNLKKIAERLKILANNYSTWDRGGCGYVAYYINKNLNNINIKSEIKIFSRFKTAKYIPKLLLIPETFENYRHDLLSIDHVVVKINNVYLDLNGLKTKEDLYPLYGYDSYQISEKVLNYILEINPWCWNPTFDKNKLCNIEKDINLAFILD